MNPDQKTITLGKFRLKRYLWYYIIEDVSTGQVHYETTSKRNAIWKLQKIFKDELDAHWLEQIQKFELNALEYQY